MRLPQGQILIIYRRHRGRQVGIGGNSTRGRIVEKIEDLKVFELTRRRGVRRKWLKDSSRAV
jgi:hypothetical protein